MTPEINLPISLIESIYDHAEKIRRKQGRYNDEQAYIYIVGCYATHTKPNCLLRMYWQQMRDAYNEGFYVRGNFDIFRAYYDMACGLISKIFGHFAWYNTLTFFEYE